MIRAEFGEGVIEENAKLRQEQEEKTGEIAELKRRLESATEENAKLRQEQEEKTGEIDKLRGELESATKENAKSEQACSNLLEAFLSKRERVDKEMRELQNLRKQIYVGLWQSGCS